MNTLEGQQAVRDIFAGVGLRTTRNDFPWITDVTPAFLYPGQPHDVTKYELSVRVPADSEVPFSRVSVTLVVMNDGGGKVTVVFEGIGIGPNAEFSTIFLPDAFDASAIAALANRTASLAYWRNRGKRSAFPLNAF